MELNIKYYYYNYYYIIIIIIIIIIIDLHEMDSIQPIYKDQHRSNTNFSKLLAGEDEHKLQTEVSNNVLLSTNKNSVFRYA